MPPTAADVSGLLRVLAAHDVKFIVIGGVCAVLHGAPVSTFDLDIVPDRSPDNVARLLEVLKGLGAVHRDPAGRTIEPDASRLGGPGHNLLSTRSGPLDVLGTIGAGRDFQSLEPRSRLVDLGDGVRVRVLDLDALIETKQEAGRDKDRAVIPILQQTLAESRRHRT
ncbi:MAG TPA: hypothetical protein VFV19_00045 [Candidatus Polarisedimenticolaceae bacterium]|nr:hypothetical protein [Candidatus Polarisedimenticolaceae bacterium]